MSDLLKKLQEWYTERCDGDWEHQYGVKIESLDNPGWAVVIDLQGLESEVNPIYQERIGRSEDDWVNCRIEENIFEGFGGPRNLEEILSVFFDWLQMEPTTFRG